MIRDPREQSHGGEKTSLLLESCAAESATCKAAATRIVTRTCHPIQAVTAKDGIGKLEKDASDIEVGDTVFSRSTPSHQYYGHIVLRIGEPVDVRGEKTHYLGHIDGHINDWCWREHIYGILVDVSVQYECQYHLRPHPNSVYERVRRLQSQEKRWSSAAESLCLPEGWCTDQGMMDYLR